MKILIIEDELRSAAYLKKGLSEYGFTIDLANNGDDGLHSALTSSYDLVILDIMLPQRDGWSVLSRLRSEGNQTPVLMLTALDAISDRVKGLELGADDYLSKPFSPRELVARIGAILRRSGWQSEGGNALRPPVIRSGDLELDPSARAASRAGKVLHLTSAEYDILRLFIGSPGQVLTRETLVERVLDRKFSPFDRSIDLHISNLRKKLGPHADGTERIRSIRGIGYLYTWPT